MKKRALVFGMLLTFILALVPSLAHAEDANLDMLNEAGINATGFWTDFVTTFSNNFIVQGIDSFFNKISPVFSFLFGIPYSSNTELLVTVLLWIYLAFIIYHFLFFIPKLVKLQYYNLLIGMVGSILLAQIKVLSLLFSFLQGIINGAETNLMKFALGIIIFFVFAIIYVLVYNLSISRIRGNEKSETKKDRKILDKNSRKLEEIEEEKERKAKLSEKLAKAESKEDEESAFEKGFKKGLREPDNTPDFDTHEFKTK